MVTMEDDRSTMREGLLGKETLSSGDGGGISLAAVVQEMRRQGVIALPMVLVNMFQFLLQVISLMMVGHLGRLSLSSASIAASLCSVTGFTILVTLSLSNISRCSV